MLDTGQARASTRLSADASGFKCQWEVDGIVHEWLSETTVLDLPPVFQALLGELADVIRDNTHTSMIDVADLSMFRLLQTPSKAAKPSAAMAVERVVKREGPCPQTAFCAAEGTLEC